jgi:hypothetical protein
MTIVSLGLTLSTIIAPPLAAGFTSINAGGLKGWQVRGCGMQPATLHRGKKFWSRSEKSERPPEL